MLAAYLVDADIPELRILQQCAHLARCEVGLAPA